MEDNEEEEEDPMFPEYGDTAMEDNAEEGGDEERASDEPGDDLGRVIANAREDCESELRG